MKIVLEFYADDVTAMVDALEEVKKKVESGATVGRMATDEWAGEFDVTGD